MSKLTEGSMAADELQEDEEILSVGKFLGLQGENFLFPDALIRAGIFPYISYSKTLKDANLNFKLVISEEVENEAGRALLQRNISFLSILYLISSITSAFSDSIAAVADAKTVKIQIYGVDFFLKQIDNSISHLQSAREAVLTAFEELEEE